MAVATSDLAAARRGVVASLTVRLSQSNVAVMLMLLAVIMALKWPVLSEPPVWDASMSVFPAAITLAENGFDYGYLLDQPGYLEGGPNVHSLSPVTLLTAIVYSLVGSGPALMPTLHVIHFVIAAFAFLGIYRLGERAFGSALSAAVTATALMVPVVLTQVGSMYLEIALLAAAAHATLALHDRRVFPAAIWLIVAVLIKGSGLLVAAALTGAVLVGTERWSHKFQSASLLLLPPLVLGALLQTQVAVDRTFNYRVFREEVGWYLLRIPDVLILLVILAVVAMLAIRIDGQTPATSNRESRALLITTVMIMIGFVGFHFVLLPLAGNFFSVLPRYYAVLIPFLILGLASAAHQIGGRRLALGGLGLILVFSIANRNGDLYPDNDLENFALIERSGAYADLLELQREGIGALATAAADVPAFYTHVEHYRFTFPEMAYVDAKPPLGHNLNTDEPFSEGNLSDFPDDFVMLHEWNWLGGEVVKSVWEQALVDPRRRVEERSISVGAFASTLILVSSR
jgi:hypothetical protein